jgi:hypothetical protein
MSKHTSIDATLKSTFQGMANSVMSMLEKEGFVMTEQLTEKIESGNYKELKSAEEKLFRWDMKYRERKGRKWLTMIAGMIICGVTCWFLVPYTVKLQHSLYNREGI